MANPLENSNFTKRLSKDSCELSDKQLRNLVFSYCEHYQKIYWFEQLENAFAYLEMTLNEGNGIIEDELKTVLVQVEDAMGEYFESLNEVATAICRLLDKKPFNKNDALDCIAHVWNAHSCNETESDYVQREDEVLCKLLDKMK